MYSLRTENSNISTNAQECPVYHLCYSISKFYGRGKVESVWSTGVVQDGLYDFA